MRRYANIDRSVVNKFMYGRAIKNSGVDEIEDDNTVKFPVVGKKRVNSFEPDHITQVRFDVRYG